MKGERYQMHFRYCQFTLLSSLKTPPGNFQAHIQETFPNDSYISNALSSQSSAHSTASQELLLFLLPILMLIITNTYHSTQGKKKGEGGNGIRKVKRGRKKVGKHVKNEWDIKQVKLLLQQGKTSHSILSLFPNHELKTFLVIIVNIH